MASTKPCVIWITFKVRERGVWRTAESLHVYSSDPSEVERIAVKYMRKREQIRVYDTDLNILTPQMCFQAAIANGSNMLLLIPEKEIDINEEWRLLSLNCYLNLTRKWMLASSEVSDVSSKQTIFQRFIGLYSSPNQAR